MSRYRQGVNALIIDQNQQILLVQLNHYQSDQWKLVGGGLQPNEDYLQAAYREIKEETNINHQDLKLIGQSQHLSKYNFPPHLKQNITRKYIGQKKEQFVFSFKGQKNKIQRQKEEIKRIKWVKIKDLKNHLKFDGQLVDVMKIIKEYNLENLQPEPGSRN